MAGAISWAGSRVNEYVSRVGQNLVRSSGSRQVFTFQIRYAYEANWPAGVGVPFAALKLHERLPPYSPGNC